MIVYVRSLPDDRTARARIRDEALGLFARRGVDAVTVRDIAGAAGVSPALVMRHYGSKDSLRAAVDEHVARLFEDLLARIGEPGDEEALGSRALASLAELVVALLPAGSPVPAYLGRLLVAGGPTGSALFARLHAAARAALAGLVDAGAAAPGADPAVRTAFLLVNDLAVVILRDRIREVLGTDPLSGEGLRRWGAEAMAIYRGGLAAPVEPG
jgi:AcrR family transcriptional regulator